MGVIKVRLLIISFSSVALCCAMDMQKKRTDSRIQLSGARRLQHEEMQDLIGKPILYKCGDGWYKKAILGEEVVGYNSYQVYLARSDGKIYKSGMCATIDKLYAMQ